MLFTVTYFVVFCCLFTSQTESLSDGLSKLLLDVEKNKILQKLNLRSRPSPNHLVRRDLPVPINAQYQKVLSEMQELNDYIPQKDETFIFAQKIDCPNPYSSGNSICFCFDSNTSVANGYDNVQVWLHKTPIHSSGNVTITIGELFSNRQQIGRQTVFSSPKFNDWTQLHLTEVNWSEQMCLIAMCNGCAFSTASEKLPFLELSATKQPRLSRQRRTEICAPEDINRCCLQRWFVNFTEIGWNDWILQPRGYEANFCTGNCLNPSADIRSKVLSDVQKVGVSPDPAIMPCCAPKHKSPVTIIYTPNRGKIEVVQIEDMVVDECECP